MKALLRKPTLGRHVDCIATRLAGAWSRQHGWQWESFDKRLSDELSVTVRTIISSNLVSGEVTGAAFRTECGNAFVIVPDSVSLEHAIHVASHEAWHLIAEHEECTDGPGEIEAEAFADRVGERIRARRRGRSGQWADILGAH